MSATVSESASATFGLESYSLLRGDWLDQILKRLGKRGSALAAVLGILITWLPLLVLSGLQGLDSGYHVRMPFIYDFNVNVRFLIALPVLIAASLVIEPRLRGAVCHFRASGLVTDENAPAFEEALKKTRRLRDSWIASVVIVLLAFAPATFNKGMGLVSAGHSWHTLPNSDVLSWAGLWNSVISVPLFRLLLFRWIWLLLLWAIFLWRVSHIDLRCVPTHPDGACGLGFLGETQVYFGMVAFASSAAVSGALGNELAYEGQTFEGIRVTFILYVVAVIVVLLSPLLALSPMILRIKVKGLEEYGVLGSRYAHSFDDKWIRGNPGEPLLGSADIQSLADLNNSFGIIRSIRLIPMNKDLLIGLGLPAIAPLIPLFAFSASGKGLIQRIMDFLV